MWSRVAGARDCAPCQKWAKPEGFVACLKAMAGVGHLKRICKDAFSVAGAVQEDMFIRAVRRSGRWFPKRGCILEHQIFSFGKMILRDRCSTAYDLASLFRGRRSTLDSFRQVEWKNRKTHSYEAVSSALNFPFLKEISQNCFVFDVVNFENWGRLAELLRFWCGQFEKWRKSRRIASFLTLSSSKNEEVSQNCCVFDGVKFKEWGSLSQNSFVFKLADRQIDR